MSDLTPEALERAERTPEAAEQIRHNAESIAALTEHAQDDEVVLAVISPDAKFETADIVKLAELHEHVHALKHGSWHMVFSPNTRAESIYPRCDEMKAIAAQRISALQRYLAKRATPPTERTEQTESKETND